MCHLPVFRIRLNSIGRKFIPYQHQLNALFAASLLSLENYPEAFLRNQLNDHLDGQNVLGLYNFLLNNFSLYILDGLLLGV
jgi:hypothetical protein